MKTTPGIITAFTLFFSVQCLAGNFSFTVTDPAGELLKGAVVSLTATSNGAKSQSVSIPLASASMAQRDKQFDPHIVAIQKGGVV